MNPMKSVPVDVEKWEKEFDDKYWIYFVQYYPEKENGLFGNIKQFISQSIQSAVEERVKRIVKEVKKLKSKEKTSIHDFSYDMAINDALSIINNQPLNK